MMKKVLLLGMLCLMFLAASCGVNFGLATGTAYFSNCQDSDGGKNYATIGAVTLWNGNNPLLKSTYKDTCAKNILTEYSCKEKIFGSSTLTKKSVLKSYTWESTTYDCGKQNLVCRDGACLKIAKKDSITCADSDGGNNTAVKGTTIGCQDSSCNNIINFTDCCNTLSTSGFTGCSATGNGVVEGICQGNAVVAPYIPCMNGCQDGACLPAPQVTCTETDGGWNYTLKGRNHGLSDGTNTIVDKEDFCNAGGFLVEYSCMAGVDGAIRVRSSTMNCSAQILAGSVCREGACKQQNTLHIACVEDADCDLPTVGFIGPCVNTLCDNSKALNLSCGAVVYKNEKVMMDEEYQYVSGDAITKTNPVAKFKNVRTGETAEYLIDVNLPSFHASFGGIRYYFTNASDARVDNWKLKYLCENDFSCVDSGNSPYVKENVSGFNLRNSPMGSYSFDDYCQQTSEGAEVSSGPYLTEEQCNGNNPAPHTSLCPSGTVCQNGACVASSSSSSSSSSGSGGFTCPGRTVPVSDSLQELEMTQLCSNQQVHNLTLVFINYTNAKFRLDSELSNKLNINQSYVFTNTGLNLTVLGVLYQSYAGGIHAADYNIR